MSKYVTTGTPSKTVGAYLKVIKALNELVDMGEEINFDPHGNPQIMGITGGVVQNVNGRYRFVQA